MRAQFNRLFLLALAAVFLMGANAFGQDGDGDIDINIEKC